MCTASPSAAAAASITASDSVGCAWIVRRRSSATAPISIARVPSAIEMGAVADDMHAEELAGLGVDDDLDEAFGVVDRERAAERGERELADLDASVAFGF